MPEIGEIARIVHFLRKHAVNKRITSVQVQEDNIVYGKVGTTATAFQKAMTGKRILDARQQGKYFWLVMDSAPHPVMHFGMTGWIKFSNDDTSHYGSKKKAPAEDEAWPPRFWKFVLKLDSDDEVAFVDARRLARIRLVDAAGDELRNTTPLKENGPDPVIDKDILTLDWLKRKLRSKRVPVKALLLDQANISGVGNWVADEILYQARIHPEQYSNSFSDDQMATLHKSLMHVCDTAVGTLADSNSFPETWLMKYRWDKGKKDSNILPNGDKIVHLKVGGRTSAIVPRVQKKTAAVAGDVSSAEVSDAEEDEEKKPKQQQQTKKKADTTEEAKSPPTQKRGRKPKIEETSDAEDAAPPTKKRGKKQNDEPADVKNDEDADAKPKKAAKKNSKPEEKATPSTGSRRSGRLSGKGSS